MSKDVKDFSEQLSGMTAKEPDEIKYDLGIRDAKSYLIEGKSHGKFPLEPKLISPYSKPRGTNKTPKKPKRKKKH